MIAPLVALQKRRKRLRHDPYDQPPAKKQKILEKPRNTWMEKSVSPSVSDTTTQAKMETPAQLGIVDEMITEDDVISGDEAMTEGDADIESLSSSTGDTGAEEPITITILPKLPFRDRANPFVNSNDPKFLKMEEYFSSLLRIPGLTVDDILELTFDDHEITLITPQSGPPDLIDWQRRNAGRYFENLKTRFSGHTNTLPFKMACLYFGFPVEPLNMGSLSPLLPAEVPLLGKADLPDFLRESKGNDEFVNDETIPQLRGGGSPGFILVEDDDSSSAKFSNRSQSQKGKLGSLSEAESSSTSIVVGDIQTEKYQMDFAWEASSPNLKPPTSAPGVVRLYGWQGVMKTPVEYGKFVSQVDKLISNWDREDVSICLEIWSASPVLFVESVVGTIQHAHYDSTDDDPVWDMVKDYFESENADNYVCFIHAGDEDHTTKENHHDTYEPLDTDRNIVHIQSAEGDVAYMRVPSSLGVAHESHQFSHEFTNAIHVLMLPEAPHAWVSYERQPVTYQSLDPPYDVWREVIQGSMFNERHDVPAHPTISFSQEPIDDDTVPIWVPGVFEMGQPPPSLNRSELTGDDASKSLQRVIDWVDGKWSKAKAKGREQIEAFEIWCPGNDFKHVQRQPTRVTFSGSIVDYTSAQGWDKFLELARAQTKPFCVVARPLYKSYRVGKPIGDKLDLQINSCTLEDFKIFVRDHLYSNYDLDDSTQTLFLEPPDPMVFQPDFTIRPETTEEEWLWIRRNLIEPELLVSLERADNEWSIPEDLIWGPRYSARNQQPINSVKSKPVARSRTKRHARKDTRRPSRRAGNIFGIAYAAIAPAAKVKKPKANVAPNKATPAAASKKPAIEAPKEPAIEAPKEPAMEAPKEPAIEAPKEPAMEEPGLDSIFRNSKNTTSEAIRAQAIRDRSFTAPVSIFSDPLKPVFPLSGTPLESIIKTGPAMPGISIAMMTPTEMVRLQREVHSLRYQLLDRTRQCPYEDCDRYFAYSDGAALDRHVREEHTVLRCFLCNEDKHLLPYYNQDQIQRHFRTKHLGEIVQAYGKGDTGGNTRIKKAQPETKCELFDHCGTITSYMSREQLKAHMKSHKDGIMAWTEPGTGPEVIEIGSDSPGRMSLSPIAWSSSGKGGKGAAEQSVPNPLAASAPVPGPGKSTAPNPFLSRSAQPKSTKDATTAPSTPTAKKPRASGSHAADDSSASNRPSPKRKAGNKDISPDRAKKPKKAAAAAAAVDSDALSSSSEYGAKADSRRKRKRLGEIDTNYEKPNSGEEEVYEYSERSAVSDPPDNIVIDPSTADGGEKKKKPTGDEGDKAFVVVVDEDADSDDEHQPARKKRAKKATSAKNPVAGATPAKGTASPSKSTPAPAKSATATPAPAPAPAVPEPAPAVPEPTPAVPEPTPAKPAAPKPQAAKSAPAPKPAPAPEPAPEPAPIVTRRGRPVRATRAAREANYVEPSSPVDGAKAAGQAKPKAKGRGKAGAGAAAKAKNADAEPPAKTSPAKRGAAGKKKTTTTTKSTKSKSAGEAGGNDEEKLRKEAEKEAEKKRKEEEKKQKAEERKRKAEETKRLKAEEKARKDEEKKQKAEERKRKAEETKRIKAEEKKKKDEEKKTKKKKG